MFSIVEIIGYIASFFVAISLLMVSIVKLRVLNLVGSLTFVIYGVFIGSIPLIITNGFICAVNVFYLLRMFNRDISRFTYLTIEKGEKRRVMRFVESFKNDILHFYPLFHEKKLDYAFSSGNVYLAVQDFTTVGFAYYLPIPEPEMCKNDDEKALIQYIHAELFPQKSVYLDVDYVTAKYRDIGISDRLYKEMAVDLGRNIDFILALNHADNRSHHKYLVKNGYKKQKQIGDQVLYSKTLV
ncbi:MAG: YgjV family protein [Spirochaetia bacterium]